MLFLDSLGIDYQVNNRTILYPLELDIYVPSHSVAIEVNGVYWHSDFHKSSTYHQEKALKCESKGIRLLQFWDMEVFHRNKIVRSMIIHALGMTPNRIGARETKVVKITNKRANDFYKENHLQGPVPLTSQAFNVALKHNDKLRCVLSIDKPRFNKNYDWEIARMATQRGWLVQGGADRLMRYASAHMTGSLITYATLMHSVGKVYNCIGMQRLRYSTPGYRWIRNTTQLTRYQVQRHKLPTLAERLGVIYSGESETDFLRKNGFLKVYDAGNVVFEGKLNGH
jgi:very-short-patch-repair endonuclease